MNGEGAILARLSRQAGELGLAHAEELARLDETAAARRALELLGASGLAAWMVPAAFARGRAALVRDTTISVRAACALRRNLAYRSAMLDVMLVMQGLGSSH